MKNIKLTQKYLSWIDEKNNHKGIERYCASKRGIDVGSSIKDKDFTLQNGRNIVGFNVDEVLSVGTPEEVLRGIIDISEEVAIALIAQGWMEETV